MTPGIHPLLEAALRDPAVYLHFTADELRLLSIITGRSVGELIGGGDAMKSEK